MKHVKTLTLAAVAAAALMAFLGVGTASATVLCTQEPVKGSPPVETERETCPVGEVYPNNTKVDAVLVPNTTFVIDTEFQKAECAESTIGATIAKEGGAAETVSTGEIAITAKKCNCEVIFDAKGTLEIHWIADGVNGTVTSSATKSTVDCNTVFGTVKCVYVTKNTDLGTLTGGNPATLDVNVKLPVEAGSNTLCPAESTWTATYEITTPKPLYVAATT